MIDAVSASVFPEVRAGGFSRLDSTVQFYQRVHALVKPESVVLDFGAGRGAFFQDPVPFRRSLGTLKGKVREVIGADVDPVVATNPGLDQAILIGPDGRLPLSDRSIDVIVSDFTFEHIEKPAAVAAELDRVLAPGGWICARTPNRFGYLAIMSGLIPESLKLRVVRNAQPDRKEEDVFPAFYRMNTEAALKRYFPEARYDHCVIAWDPEPAYYFGKRWLYKVFKLIHAMTPDRFKIALLIFLHKTDAGAGEPQHGAPVAASAQAAE
jgi:SAM-dependent methyltransferase